MSNLLADPLMQEYIQAPDKFLRVNPDKIGELIQNQAALFGRATYLYGMAKRESAFLKMALETEYGLLIKKLKDEGVPATLCDSFAKTDERYRKFKQHLIEADFQESLFKSLVDGLVQRKDMIVTAATMMRQEMQSNIRIMEESARSFYDQLDANKGGGL